MSHEILPTTNVLVVRFSAIGDILLITPLLRALRAQHPGARISVLTKRQYLPLLADNPHVDDVVGIDRTTRLTEVAARLRRARYTHLLDLHGSLRTRALRLLVPGRWQSYSKRGVARELLIRTKWNIYRDEVPVPERYFEAAADLDLRPDGGPLEFFLNPQAEARAQTWLAAAGIGQQRPLVALAPGAAHATKRWPLPHWASLAHQVIATGADVVVLGGTDDSPLASELVAQVGAPMANAAGALGLQETGAVIKRSVALISGDTGVMHMATGLGTPVVALWADGSAIRVLSLQRSRSGTGARPLLPPLQRPWQRRVPVPASSLYATDHVGRRVYRPLPQIHMTGWDPTATALLELVPGAARGPKRESIFALWLTVRVAQDLLLEAPPPERAHRRRVDALAHRLSSLTLPPPLRRALTAAIDQLRDGTPTSAAQVLSQLVAPARETGGPEIGDVIGQAARRARAALRAGAAPS